MQSTEQRNVAGASDGEYHQTFDLIFAFDDDWRENAMAIDADGAVWIGRGDRDEFVPSRMVTLAAAVRWFADHDPLSSSRTGYDEGQHRFLIAISAALEGREP